MAQSISFKAHDMDYSRPKPEQTTQTAVPEGWEELVHLIDKAKRRKQQAKDGALTRANKKYAEIRGHIAKELDINPRHYAKLDELLYAITILNTVSEAPDW